MGRVSVNRYLLPGFLVTACLVPAAFGTIRAVSIISEGQWALEFMRDHTDRLPLFLHILCAVTFLLLGTLQIWPRFRTRHMRWHRRAGKIAATAGLIGAATGIWMTLAHPGISTALLAVGRIGASAFWGVAIILAVRAVLRRDIPHHRAWMIRAYAIALPAGTLAFILAPMVIIMGEEGHEMLFDAIQVAAWPLHLAVAEWFIRRPKRRRPLALPAPA